MSVKTVNGIAIRKRILQLKPLLIGSSSVLQAGHASRYVGAMSMTNIKTKAHQKNLYILTILSQCLREIHQNVKNWPERDNKNPINTTSINADVTRGGETPFQRHAKNDEQPYNSTQHVNRMAPDQYIKDATVDSRLKRESVTNQLHPFAPLYSEEEKPKDTRKQKPFVELLYQILLDRTARLKHRVAAQ
jgi:hypothetical protein